MTTFEQRLDAILACPDPDAPAVAESLCRRATPLDGAAIIHLLRSSAPVCQALREIVAAGRGDRAVLASEIALYSAIRDAEPERRIWADGFYVEDGKLFVRLCVHQFEWSSDYGGYLARRSRDTAVAVDEILGEEAPDGR